MCKRLKHSRQLTKHLPSIDAYQLLRHACSHSLYFPERVGHIGLQLGWGYNLGDGCRLLLFCSWLASRLACTLSLAHCHNSFCLMAFVSVCVRLLFASLFQATCNECCIGLAGLAAVAFGCNLGQPTLGQQGCGFGWATFLPWRLGLPCTWQ